MTSHDIGTGGLDKGYQMKVKNKTKMGTVLSAACILFSAAAYSQQQGIVLQEQSAYDGYRQAVLIYHVSNNDLTTGLGFRVHYDSSKVNILEIVNYLEGSNVGIQIMADTDDLDLNPDTDSYINAAWVDLNGDWPSAATLPASLYSFTFDAIDAEASDLFTISQASSPPGFGFVSTIISAGAITNDIRLDMESQ